MGMGEGELGTGLLFFQKIYQALVEVDQRTHANLFETTCMHSMEILQKLLCFFSKSSKFSLAMLNSAPFLFAWEVPIHNKKSIWSPPY